MNDNTTMTQFDMEALMSKIKTNDFVRAAKIPLGYVPDYPMISGSSEKPVLVIPFLKYKVTGVVDKTLVFPVRYVLIYELKEKKFTGFYNLSKIKDFDDFDFEAPIGLFRHESIRDLDKNAYKEKQKELYKAYSAVINTLLDGQEPAETDISALKNLLGIMLEPSVRPFYKLLSPSFCQKYLP